MTLYNLIEKQWNQICKKNRIGDSRVLNNVIYRQAYMMACLEHTKLTLKSIGKIMKRDHATIVYAKKQHLDNMNYTLGYPQLFMEFCKMVEELVCKYDKNENEAMMDILQYSGTTSEEIVSIMKKKNRMHLKRIEESYERKHQQFQHEMKVLKRHNTKLQIRLNEVEAEAKRLKNLL
tara:strand:- start:248 stop:778 length:531 start_codon:yes stop_codon:yes gene_type:complete